MALATRKTFIASNLHGRYCVPASSSHRPAAATILDGKVWEAETIAFLTAHCADGDIVHAGTYFGDFLPALSAGVAPGAHVWAFEPSAEHFQCAEATLGLNDIENVTLAHAALGEAAGTALLRIGAAGKPPRGGASAIKRRRRPGRIYEEVRVVTIDEAVPLDGRVSIIQLDVEQYEQQALAGGLSTIRRCRPVLVLENLPTDPSWFEEHVLGLGYAKIAELDRNIAFDVIRTPDS